MMARVERRFADAREPVVPDLRLVARQAPDGGMGQREAVELAIDVELPERHGVSGGRS